MVQTIPGTIPLPPATVGIWTPGSVTVKEVDKISVDGNKVIYEAECTFSFSGTQPNPSPPPPTLPVTGSSTVTLTASPTVLTDNSRDLLRLGDIKVDAYGNTVFIAPGQIKLRTA